MLLKLNSLFKKSKIKEEVKKEESLNMRFLKIEWQKSLVKKNPMLE